MSQNIATLNEEVEAVVGLEKIPNLAQPKETKPMSQVREMDFLQNRFVYLNISARARGLSIGINLNPDQVCNFDCVYCNAAKTEDSSLSIIDPDVVARELESTLQLVHSGELQRMEAYSKLPRDLLNLKAVELSGFGEPTASPRFLDVVETLVHIRAMNRFPFFKIVLFTNASRLNYPNVQAGLALFTQHDEIWAKLDAGTEAYFNNVNRSSEASFRQILENICHTAQKRPVVIQSLFASYNNRGPNDDDIREWANRLREITEAGGIISSVQVCSGKVEGRPHTLTHLQLRRLNEIAAMARKLTGLKVEIF